MSCFSAYVRFVPEADVSIKQPAMNITALN